MVDIPLWQKARCITEIFVFHLAYHGKQIFYHIFFGGDKTQLTEILEPGLVKALVTCMFCIQVGKLSVINMK
jgi:hypothetical protein